jgi:hypothetical protein
MVPESSMPGASKNTCKKDLKNAGGLPISKVLGMMEVRMVDQKPVWSREDIDHAMRFLGTDSEAHAIRWLEYQERVSKEQINNVYSEINVDLRRHAVETGH